MRKSVERRFCLGLLLFAVFVRSISAVSGNTVLQQGLTEEEPKQTEAKITGSQLMQTVETEPVTFRVQNMVQKETVARVAAVQPEPFTPEEAKGISIGGQCTYKVDRQTLLLQPTHLDFSADGPKVLIVHTHSCEAYTPEAGWEYEASENLRTTDPAFSVIRVGDEIAEVLTAGGIEVLHDTTLNDFPDYEGAYERMRLTIEDYLNRYPSIQMVLDIHRDAVQDENGAQLAFLSTQQALPYARLMLVVGTDEGGLFHPAWRENLANAMKLQAMLERTSPGLCRDIDLRTERFNAHETPGSLLIEVGSTGNTLQQALRSARTLGEALRDLILWNYGK